MRNTERERERASNPFLVRLPIVRSFRSLAKRWYGRSEDTSANVRRRARLGHCLESSDLVCKVGRMNCAGADRERGDGGSSFWIIKDAGLSLLPGLYPGRKIGFDRTGNDTDGCFVIGWRGWGIGRGAVRLPM